MGVTVVKDAVAEWKRQRREVFVPLTYRPGDLAEVDFFEVLVDVDGTRRKAWLFLMRLMYSGRDFAWIYERQDQISFLDGHVRAFAHFDGRAGPRRVRQSAGGRRPDPGRRRAHADAAVRRARLALPAGGVLLSARARATIKAASSPAAKRCGSRCSCRFRSARRSRSSTRPCWRRWMRGSTPSAMRPARPSACASPRSSASSDSPRLPFAPEATTFATVSPRALVRLEGAVYSVPSRWAGLDLVVRIGATTVTIVGREGTRILHPRKRFGQRSIDYRHYLSELARKPQAVRQVLPDLLRDLGDPFPAIWDQLHGAHGPREAARLFAKVLGQLETHGAAVVVPALTAALATGTPLLLALTPARSALARVALDAVPAPLRDIDVASGCAADYDGWLLGGAA